MLSNMNLSNVKIAISGKSGCGNTTICRILADKLKLNFINFTFGCGFGYDYLCVFDPKEGCGIADSAAMASR